jgi:hypothetical protein
MEVCAVTNEDVVPRSDEAVAIEVQAFDAWVLARRTTTGTGTEVDLETYVQLVPQNRRVAFRQLLQNTLKMQRLSERVVEAMQKKAATASNANLQADEAVVVVSK